MSSSGDSCADQQNRPLGDEGFTLVEMLITLSIMLAAMGALTMLSLNQVKSIQSATQKSEVDSIHLEIASVLSNQTSCTATFSGQNALSTPKGIVLSVSRVVSTSPPATAEYYRVKGQTGAVEREGISILSYEMLSSTNPSNDLGVLVLPTETQGSALLRIEYEKKMNDTVTRIIKNLRIGVRYQVSGSRYNIVDCQSYGIPLNSFVDGDLTVQGNVITESVELNPNDEGECGNTSDPNLSVGKGRLRYSQQKDGLQYCDGFAWYNAKEDSASSLMGARPQPEDIACANPQGSGGACNSTGIPEILNSAQAWCPPGYGLVRISGGSGWAFDRLRLECRHHVTGASFQAAEIGNDSGGAAFTGTACPSGSFISRVAIRVPSTQERSCGYTVTGLKYWCTSLTRPDQVQEVFVRRGSRIFGGEYWQEFRCPRQQVISEVDLQAHRRTDWLNASNRQNCDCRNCIANLQFNCRYLDKGISVTEP